jgi:competence protein ComEA
MPLIATLICAAAETPAPVVAVPADAAEAAPPRAEKPHRKGKPPMLGVVNVNRASTAELRLLPGIGKKRAEMIVERREKKPFTSIDEVGRLKGMRNVAHRLRAQLVVQGDTTLHPAARP